MIDGKEWETEGIILYELSNRSFYVAISYCLRRLIFADIKSGAFSSQMSKKEQAEQEIRRQKSNGNLDACFLSKTYFSSDFKTF